MFAALPTFALSALLGFIGQLEQGIWSITAEWFGNVFDVLNALVITAAMAEVWRGIKQSLRE
jgi:hypothetical protein